MSRRRFLIGAGTLAAASRVRAQPTKRLPVLGILSPGRRPTQEEWDRHPATAEFAKFGWIAGQTLSIEHAYAEGNEALLPDLASGLGEKRVHVIWARGPEAAIAAARATTTIPLARTLFPRIASGGRMRPPRRPHRSNPEGMTGYLIDVTNTKRNRLPGS